MKPGEKTRVDLKKGEQLLHNMMEMEGRTCLACRLGRLVEYVPVARTRPSARRARLVANPFCTVTKSGEVSFMLTSPLLAGAEGLEPSARGFGVDVVKASRNIRAQGFGCAEPFLSADNTSAGTLMLY